MMPKQTNYLTPLKEVRIFVLNKRYGSLDHIILGNLEGKHGSTTYNTLHW